MHNTIYGQSSILTNTHIHKAAGIQIQAQINHPHAIVCEVEALQNVCTKYEHKPIHIAFLLELLESSKTGAIHRTQNQRKKNTHT